MTSNLTMSDGIVRSNDGIGITISETGNITGGQVYGGTYGVDSKNTLTLGSDDGTISNEYPMLEGELYGLYIEGSTTNFYDGILKGQTDGYTGSITGTPLGGVVFEGIEERENDVIYQTDYVSVFDSWLRIGDTLYNTLNAASEACEDTCRIVVTRDADITFTQRVLGENKNITLDLNGHKITTTQNITNYSNLTIEDTQVEEDAGTGPGIIKNIKNTGIINEKLLTINGGKYESIVDQIIVNNARTNSNDGSISEGGLTINNATFNVSNTAIKNTGTMLVNGINIENSIIGIDNTSSVVVNGTKNSETNEYTTVINGSNYAIYTYYGTVRVNGGKLMSPNSAINGYYGTAIVNETKNINLPKNFYMIIK